MTPTLPVGWRKIPLGDLIRIGHGYAFEGEHFAERGINAILTPGNFHESGGFRDVGAKQRFYAASYPAVYNLVAGDLIVAMTEQATGLLGSAAFVPENGHWLHNQRIGRISRISDEVIRAYLFYIFNSVAFRTAVNETAAGTKVKHTSPKKLEAIDILLPPLKEQESISGAIDDAAALIVTLERLIAKKQAIKQGMMQQLLTGRTRLPGFDGPWSPRRLNELLSYEQPWRYLVQTSRQLESGRVPVLTAGKTFVLGYTNDTRGVYKAHPVIIFDDFTTASKYVNFDFKAKSSAMKILSARPGVDLRFAYERMQLIDFPLGDHKRYWISEYSKLVIMTPDEAEQRAIGVVIADFDRELEALRNCLEEKQVKTGMMQQLLTGRTRLPVQETAA